MSHLCRPYNLYRLVQVCLLVTLTAGCAATKDGMTVSTPVSKLATSNKAERFHVVNVKGNTFVDSKTLKESINDSLRNAGLYSNNEGSVSIDVDLWKLEPSVDLGAGLLFYSEYVAEINYKLYTRKAVVKNLGISHTDRVTITEMPIGEIRGQKAREKAIRGNVEKFLSKLSE